MLATACSSDEIGTSESAVVVCGQTSVKGLDVYHGDNGGNPIDWNAVAAGGMSFAFMKATEGTTFVDSSFATNWPGVKAAGMVRGAYHFFHSDLDPVVQATFFLATVGPITQDDLLVLDLETTNGQTAATILSHAETFMATVKAKSGTTPILYTSPAFLTSYGTLGAYPLWIANYAVTCPNVPSEWSTYTFWQSTGSGTFAPLSGSVDLDTFNGTLAQLKALGSTLVTADGGLANNDAGASDAASTDATPPPTDASPKTDAATADAGDFEPAGPSGCACTLGATSSRGGVASYGLLAAVALLRRRRQRSGNIANTKTRGARDSADKTSAGGALGSSHDTSAASASPR
jgi:lysozyme